ncbi:MAG: TolC family protein [Oculatellaceae cyanobacterium Prado106]|nr:TolC family protein [Oculatellaceae cyanobacterium Prado106]
MPDVVSLLLQNNRQLRNSTLSRIIQREQLRDVESTFAPRLEPLLGLGVSQTFANLPVPINSDPLTETAQITGRMRTPIGTEISVTVNPLETRRVGITISQPLLRGAGERINEAPIERARQGEVRNILSFQQGLIDRITEATIAYRAIARAQEALKIQQLSIENQRQQLRFIEVLVNANRSKPNLICSLCLI